MADERRRAGVGAAIGAAAALRLGGLDREGLWLDELFTARVVGRESWAGLVDELAGDVHPPLYYALLRLFTALAGDSDVALRAPSAIAGVLAVAGVYRLGRRLAGTGVGLAGAWLLAVAPFAVALDREARSNALLALLGVVGANLAADALTGGPRRTAAWAVLVAALLWTHPFGGFVAAALLGWVALEDRGVARAWLGGAVAGAVAFLPWVGVLAAQLGRFRAAPWYGAPSPDALGWLWLGLGADHTGPAVLLALGVALALARGAAPAAGTLVASGLVAVVLLPQALSLGVAPVLRDRNVIALLPWICVAAGAGWASLAPRRLAVAGLAVAVGASGLTAVTLSHARARGEQWREAAEAVAAGWREGDRMYAVHPQLWRHYLPDAIAPDALPDDPGALVADLDAPRSWLAWAHALDDDAADRLVADGIVVTDVRLRGARVLLLDPLGAPVAIGEGLPSPTRDAGGLHFYWAQAARSAPLALRGRCAIGLLVRGETAGGEPARLAMRVLEGETVLSETLLDLPTELAWRQVGVEEQGAPVTIELAFTNDGVATGDDGAPEDRNAHVVDVRRRCVVSGG